MSDRALWQEFCKMEADRDRLRALLTRLSQWDQMNPPMSGDHAHWKREIDAALAGAAVPACESRCADERCRRTGDCQKPGNCIAPDQPGRSQPASVGHPVCQSCGAFVDSRGKCRIPEHNP